MRPGASFGLRMGRLSSSVSGFNLSFASVMGRQTEALLLVFSMVFLVKNSPTRFSLNEQTACSYPVMNVLLLVEFFFYMVIGSTSLFRCWLATALLVPIFLSINSLLFV